ncbi:MAG: hypothetical protein J5687_00905 [Treponema sp.]|nr:hypothetical protein [Treponema sp.]
MNKVLMKKADCALDLGDGSERGLYVNQDYILQKLHCVHRGISLMYTYYPNDKEWPTRACNIKRETAAKHQWDSPYENYFPYRGGREGLLDNEPFNFMNDIRRHGMDVVLTMTIDPSLTEKDIIEIAHDLRPYGRVLLRVNHECTGSWFCYTRRATYQHIADFFVMVCRVMHEHAPNVKMILCAGLFDDATGKIEMEDIFLEAHKACDIWSGDNYLSLHWGWPNDIAKKPGTSFGNFDTEKTYQKFKKSVMRLREITGMNKPMVLSEMNADGDVNGPYDQARKLRDFMERLETDPDKWLDGFTLYQFRDDGRLGLEITDPNNSDVGIEQPILKSYRESLHKPFFSKKFETAGALQLPVKLRWSNSEDAEGIELDVPVEKDPHFAELYFKDDLIQANLMMEFGGWWFYKAPGVKCIDLMSYFFENKISKACTMKLRIFAPPADGKNHPFGEGDDWLYNYYAELSSLPEIRLEYEPVVGADDEYKFD